MRKLVRYQCEICSRRYETTEEAQACEDQGLPSKDGWPVGLVFNDPSKGFYKDITFAIAELEPSIYNPHRLSGSLWACRNNGAGDDLGDTRCGPLHLPLHQGREPDPSHKTYQRLVVWLESQGISVTCWDGEKAITRAEYEALRQSERVQ